MATGDIWDNGMGHAGAPTSSTSNNMLSYSLPSLMDGLAVNVSYVPHTSTQYEGTFDWAQSKVPSYCVLVCGTYDTFTAKPSIKEGKE